MSLAALLLAIVKAVPAAAAVAEQFTALYTSWKKSQNAKYEDATNRRNDAAVDAAADELPTLCPTCPFAGKPKG